MMAEVDIASHDLMTKETGRTEPEQELTSHTLSVPAPMRIKASSGPRYLWTPPPTELRTASYLRGIRLQSQLTHLDPLEGSPQSTIPSTNCLPPGTIGVPHRTFLSCYKDNITYRLFYAIQPSVSASTTTASTNPNTSAGVPNNHSAVDHIGNPEDTSVDELNELLNYPRNTTLPDGSQLRQDPGAPLPLEDRVRQLSMLQIKKKTAKTTDSQITNDSQNKTRDEAMDLDDPLTSLADTPKRPNSPDIVALSKKERIRLMIKEHIAIWKKFELEKPSGATPELRTILHQAQDSQKALQKLITKEELEGYVKGWNPWDAKRELFPPPPKKEGKKKSSTLRKAQQYDDPRVWADVFEIGQAWRAAYRQRSRKELPP
ncbi:hypothetical protein PGTUg99_006186 [Puccinia graminis f. sp. tritici]|uniref:Uncharacterized protein n=1 Tax=Puccinia graminis f. sp. tritici TaxID=56615 RepID=A0A5B0RSL5_PUCGR|nr:hypothetical protein PGTUg99_006186 [Puccinia graminis f. sp. tritici]